MHKRKGLKYTECGQKYIVQRQTDAKKNHYSTQRRNCKLAVHNTVTEMGISSHASIFCQHCCQVKTGVQSSSHMHMSISICMKNCAFQQSKSGELKKTIQNCDAKLHGRHLATVSLWERPILRVLTFEMHDLMLFTKKTRHPTPRAKQEK